MSSNNHQYGNLISEVKNNLYTHLKASLTEMFSKMDDSLFKTANSNISSKEQNRYFELMRNSQILKDSIIIEFIEIISHSLRPHAETQAEKDKRKLKEEDELSLVEQAELEEMVLIKSIANNVSGLFGEPLSQLETRLEHLAVRTPDIFSKDSLTPANIIQAFDDALGSNFDAVDKKTLLTFFNEHVALKLGNAYDLINKILSDAGILPDIKLHANKSASKQMPRHTAPAADQATSNTEPDHEMNQGGYAMTAAPGHNNPAASYNASSNTDGQQQNFGPQTSQITNAISEYFGGTPLSTTATKGDQTGTSASDQFFPVSTGQHYGHEEVLSALSGVQHNPAFSNAENAPYDAEAIKQAVLSEIAKSSGGMVTKGLNRVAEKTIDFIELIFDAIIDDDDISDAIKTLLLRLQIPVIKIAMIDHDFFIHDDHPARLLLDNIAHVGIGVSDHSDDIYIHLNKIVTTLVNEFELLPNSFQIALDTLNAFLEEREAEALKKEAEEQKKVLREHARSTVLKSLRTATRGKILPETIHALVLKRWPTMMYNHYLEFGKENDEWVNIVDTLRSIINSVQPLSNANDLDHLTSTRVYLIKTTRSYLQTTNQSEDDIEQVTQDLIQIHQSHIDQANFSEAPQSDEIEELTKKKIATEILPVEEEDNDDLPKLSLPSNMVPGMWFQVYNGEDKAQRRCKLSVVILEDQNLVFVNYHGEVIIEKNLGNFLDELDNGKSKVIMGHSIFDHALSSAVNHLQQPH
ncbi:MAG: DUF1631 family protein [Gammaproteobacteria bacterium]|nr:DUF1631 family protein [Gammaproteobacteria bacterium]